jgi:hypothetical protein
MLPRFRRLQRACEQLSVATAVPRCSNDPFKGHPFVQGPSQLRIAGQSQSMDSIKLLDSRLASFEDCMERFQGCRMLEAAGQCYEDRDLAWLFGNGGLRHGC